MLRYNREWRWSVKPRLLAFFMVLLVRERPAAMTAKSKINASIWQFPKNYWKYLAACRCSLQSYHGNEHRRGHR